MNREEIKKLLPHREPMLLIDDVDMADDMAIGHYLVRGDEFFLQGHFPSSPVVPGVILCEMLAQTACALVKDRIGEEELPMYAGIDRARFRAPVRPGDQVETSCRIIRKIGAFYFARGSVRVGDKVCAEAAFSFALAGR